MKTIEPQPWTSEITQHPEVAKNFLCSSCDGLSYDSSDGPWCGDCDGDPVVMGKCFVCDELLSASESFLVDIEAQVVCLRCSEDVEEVVSDPQSFVGRKPEGDYQWVKDAIGHDCDFHADLHAFRLANVYRDRDVLESDAAEHKLN